MVETPTFRNANKDKPDYEIEWFGQPDIKWFQGFATIMLSYNCQVFFFFVRGEMMRKSSRRVRKVVILLMSIVCLIFLGMCYSAYFSLGKNSMPVLYTLRKKISSRVVIQVMNLKIF